MIYSKKLTGLCAGLALLATSSLAHAAQSTSETYAGTVSLSEYANIQAGDGGEFTAFGAAVPTGYAADALYQGNSYPAGFTTPSPALETFCVEDSTYFYQSNDYNSSYAYSITNYIQVTNGGASEGNQSVPYTPVALNAGVAYLYSQFATGQLSIGTDATKASELQTAIWELQNLPADPADQTLDLGNPYVQLAITGTGSLTNAKESVIQLGNNFGVQVMDLYLWSGPGGLNTTYNPTNGGYSGSSAGLGQQDADLDDTASFVFQDQLIYTGVNVPDGGLTVGLLGVSLLALAFVKRRNARTA